MSLYLKWTRAGRTPSYQGGAPIAYRKWTEPATPILCESGWHACRWEDALPHISDELWIAELAGDIVEGDDKVAAERLRIVRRVKGVNERTLRLFAADCGETVLPIFEKAHPGDDRPRLAIQAARDCANGKIGAAARDAARAAARDAAGDAAWAAGWAAGWDAAGDAAWAAAGDAAWAAGWDAVGDAAWDAARAAQTERLLEFYGGLMPADFAHKENQL
jgi:hypothetical protein